MAKQIRFRGGTTAQHSVFTGAIREITVDTDKDTLVVHDGTTVGGFPLARESVVTSGLATKVDKNANIVAGTNTKITYDAKGLVTGGSTPTTLSGYGITDATPSSHIGTTGASHGVATTSVNGFMSSTDKTKLDGIASGATANTGTVTSITAGGYLTGGTITGSGTIAVDATSVNTASKVVARDASGNFSAETITANLTGTARNASYLNNRADYQFLRQDFTAGETRNYYCKVEVGGGLKIGAYEGDWVNYLDLSDALYYKGNKLIGTVGGTYTGNIVMDNGTADGPSVVWASTGYPTIQADNLNGNWRLIRDNGTTPLSVGSDNILYSHGNKVWHAGNVNFDTGNTPNTAVYRNQYGNFNGNDVVLSGALYLPPNTSGIKTHTGKELLWHNDDYLSIGYGTNYTRTYKPFVLNNDSAVTPAVVMTSNGYASWEMDVSNGIFRLRTTNCGDNREIIKITPSTPTPNEAYKFVVQSVYNNTSSTGVAVVVDGDGGIRRQMSSIKYKTTVEDIYKEAVDTFFANARPIYYKDKYPQEGKDWGYWGFIAEEVAEFDKRLVHYGYSGTKEEVVKKATYYTEDDELPEGKEVGDEKTPDIVSEVIDTSSPLTPEGIMYDRITVLLTAKVQEQDKEIKSLREELDELKLIVKGLIV